MKLILTKKINHLLKLSRSMVKKSYSPYSKFKVGAAIRTSNGKIFSGCNIESASYGLTICAERVALFKAISDGYTQFEAIAISSSEDKPAFPCGACRQFLSEFNSEMLVYLDNDQSVYRLSQLIPNPFRRKSV
jgi:cytidine deaminase